MEKVSSDNPMMQPLECRRMMSIAPGAEAAPAMFSMPAAAIVQAHHSFQNTDRSTASDNGVESEPVPPQPGFGGFHFGMDPGGAEDFENQLVSAIAQGNSIAITPAADQNHQRTSIEISRPATLSELYGTLGNSTVAEIDSATSSASAESVGVSVKASLIPAILNLRNSGDSSDVTAGLTATVSEAPPLPAPPAAPAPVAEILLSSLARPTGAQSTTPADLGLFGFESTATAPRSTLQSTTAPAAAASLVSRDTLQSLERQLAAIQNYSRELVMNMGRDNFAGLTQAVTNSDAAPEAHSISGWKTYAAVVGAAVAGVLYTQNEIVRGRTKLDGVFSSRLIHAPAL